MERVCEVCFIGKPGKNETIRKNENAAEDRIQILHKIPHDGEVNRARHSPHEQNYIATRTPLGQVHIFNTHRIRKENMGPEIVLLGHNTEGYALEWNPHKAGMILAGSYDGKMSLWDIKHTESKSSGSSDHFPISSYKFHS